MTICLSNKHAFSFYIVILELKRITINIIEGSLEVKVPTICRDGKAGVGRVRKEKSRSEKRKSEKQAAAGARKGRKVTIHYVFPMIWGSGGSKRRLARAAGVWLDEKSKIARRCGIKHVSKSKCTKHISFGAL